MNLYAKTLIEKWFNIENLLDEDIDNARLRSLITKPCVFCEDSKYGDIILNCTGCSVDKMLCDIGNPDALLQRAISNQRVDRELIRELIQEIRKRADYS